MRHFFFFINAIPVIVSLFPVIRLHFSLSFQADGLRRERGAGRRDSGRGDGDGDFPFSVFGLSDGAGWRVLEFWGEIRMGIALKFVDVCGMCRLILLCSDIFGVFELRDDESFAPQ